MTNPANFSDYFQEFRNVPQKWEDAANFLNWYLLTMTNFLNAKVNGTYTTENIPCGKQLFITSTAYDVQRKTIVVGTLPNAGTLNTAHGIDTSKGFRLINLYLAANDVINEKYFCLQYFSLASADITIDMDSTNVIIATSSDYSPYTDCYVVIEYVQGVP